jgi:hypothetical protein
MKDQQGWESRFLNCVWGAPVSTAPRFPCFCPFKGHVERRNLRSVFFGGSLSWGLGERDAYI